MTSAGGFDMAGEKRVTTKTELMADIERDWTAINRLLDGLTRRQLTQIRNPDGWAVKDHVAHLTVWEESAIVFLQGMPRHTGLGVPESVYLTGDLDAINQVIFQQRRNTSWEYARRGFQTTHARLLALLAPLNDADLLKPYAHYLPDEPGEEEGPPAIDIVYGNTAHHYRLHQAWIEAMLDADSAAG